MNNYFFDPYLEMNKKIEKKELRKTGNNIALALFIASFLSVIVSVVIVTLMTFVTGDADRATYLLTQDLVVSNITNSLVCALVFVFPFVFLMKLIYADNDVKSVFSAPNQKFSTCAMYSLFVVLVSLGAGLVTNMVSTFFSIFTGSEPYVPSLGENYSNPVFAFGIDLVCSCVFPALVEEFAFRGVILNTLKKYGDIPAIVVSSLLFGLMHGNFVQLPYTFIMGLALGFVTVKTKSIYCAVGAHFINNFMAVLQDWFPTLGGIAVYIIIALSIVSTIILARRKLLTRNADYTFSYFREGTRIKYIILAPAMIVYIVLQLISSFQFMQ